MKKTVFTIAALIVIVGLFVWGSISKKMGDTAKTSREVALTCTTDMATEFHIHPELSIFVNGEQITIPTDLGVTPACMTSIHTHDSTGIIHVEAPIQKDFTLGDFFAVWNKDFSKTKLFENSTDQDSEII